MKRLELFIEGIILASRWLLVIFYIGLAIALALYAATFGYKLWDFASHLFSLEESDSILKMLSLIDAALIASLVVMVIISGYENFVSRFDESRDVHWLGDIDIGSLKVKVASTIGEAAPRFASMEKLEDVPVVVRGETVWTFEIWLGRDFKP